MKNFCHDALADARHLFLIRSHARANRYRIFPLSALNQQRSLVRVSCRYCKRSHVYYPDYLIQIFGDVDVDSLMGRMRCEAGDHGPLDVKGFVPTGSEAVGLSIRRLVALKIRRVPVWREE